MASRCIAVLALVLVAVPARAELVRLQEPSVDSVALADEAIRKGMFWLVTTDGAQVETRGGWKFTERTVQFKDQAQILLSLRLADIDFQATETFNQEVRTGYYVDERIKRMANARVRRLNKAELTELVGELRADTIEKQQAVYDIQDEIACYGLRGTAGAMCSLAQVMSRPSASEAVDEALAKATGQ